MLHFRGVKLQLIGLKPLRRNLTHSQRCHSETGKNILDDLVSSVLPQFKKYHPSGNLKFINLGIYSKLKISYFNGENPSDFP